MLNCDVPSPDPADGSTNLQLAASVAFRTVSSFQMTERAGTGGESWCWKHALLLCTAERSPSNSKGGSMPAVMATDPPRRRWRRGLAIGAASALAVAGATVPAVQALPEDDSEAEGRLLSGGGVVDLNSIAALNPAYSADPSATGVAQNPLSLDVLNALDIDLGDGVQLFGENGVVGVGALAQYARTNPGEAPFASSGAVNADGTIAFAPTDPNQNAFLDLGPLLDAAGLAELLSAARLAAPGRPSGDCQAAAGTPGVHGRAVAALSDGVYDVLGDVPDPLNDLVGEGGAIDAALQPLLGGLSELVDGLLTVVGGSLSPLSVSATLDLDLQAAVDSVLSQPLTSDDSAVTLDLSTGEILVDLSMLVRDSQGGPFEGTLNGLDPNTEVLGPHVVQAALDGAI